MQPGLEGDPVKGVAAFDSQECGFVDDAVDFADAGAKFAYAAISHLPGDETAAAFELDLHREIFASPCCGVEIACFADEMVQGIGGFKDDLVGE